MKQHTLTFAGALLGCLLVSACGKTTSDYNYNNLAGTWKMVTVGHDNNHNNVPDADEIKDTNLGVTDHIMVLNDDHTGSIAVKVEDIILYTPITWIAAYKQIHIHELSGNKRDYALAFYRMSPTELIRGEDISCMGGNNNDWFVYKKQ